jgi:tol-pal system beta propeller repeat protein TolB
MNKTRFFSSLVIPIFLAGCNLPASTPTSDLFATLQASTPSIQTSSQTTQSVATLALDASTLTPSPIPSAKTSVPSPSTSDQPQGQIVYNCQLFKTQATEQICIINADGTGFKRLTTADGVRHYYPSLAPDGRSVLYSAFQAENNFEIYKMDITGGAVTRMTDSFGVDNAPEFSPDGLQIVFVHGSPIKNTSQIVLMDRNGDHAENIPQIFGWDPTWSPDGKQILFASDRDGSVQLYTVRTDGKQLHRVTNLPAIRGRSDWSPDGQYIVTYSGEPWKRELFIMNADGSNVRQLTPLGGNSQGPSFSPDGKWVIFTAYFDRYGDDHGCELYIIRVDGTDLRRLTNNEYCDYQPRWGP